MTQAEIEAQALAYRESLVTRRAYVQNNLEVTLAGNDEALTTLLANWQPYILARDENRYDQVQGGMENVRSGDQLCRY